MALIKPLLGFAGIPYELKLSQVDPDTIALLALTIEKDIRVERAERRCAHFVDLVDIYRWIAAAPLFGVIQREVAINQEASFHTGGFETLSRYLIRWEHCFAVYHSFFSVALTVLCVRRLTQADRAGCM